MKAKNKIKTNREEMMEAIKWIKSTPNGVVRFRPETKKEMKELICLVDELVEEEWRPKIEIN